MSRKSRRRKKAKRKEKKKSRRRARRQAAATQTARKQAVTKTVPDDGRPRCGLCGNTENLTKTECCDNWVCDDEHEYVPFSFARNSCHRNHRRFTLCGHHHAEGHRGHWKDCPRCRESFDTEIYVWRGTNEYNFEVLENPPPYEPTKCAACGRAIHLGTETYSQGPDGYLCEACTGRKFGDLPL